MISRQLTCGVLEMMQWGTVSCCLRSEDKQEVVTWLHAA